MVSESRKLHIHHIGGRFGNGGFPVLERFERDFVRVFYDADAECLGQIRERFKDSSAQVHVFPFCLGEGERRGSFHINYDPTSSSLYRFHPEYGSFYFFCYNHDFIVSENMHTMETREVDVMPLDSLFSAKSPAFSTPPDFLSMDVQGAEHDLLEGAEAVLENNVLALTLEAWFHPVYADQKLFGDVSRLLSQSGFHFVKFLKFTEYTPFRYPIGQRGEGFQVFADALFLKKIDEVEKDADAAGVRYAKLRKLAFIALVFNQTEYALECLERSRNLNTESREDTSGIEFYDFLEKIEKSAMEMTSRYPGTFREKYSYELSKLRFASRQDLKACRTTGPLQRGRAEQIWLCYVYPRIYDIARVYNLLIEKIWSSAASLFLPNNPIERILIRYGLRDQARAMKKKRVVQSFFSRKQKKGAAADEQEMNVS